MKILLIDFIIHFDIHDLGNEKKNINNNDTSKKENNLKLNTRKCCKTDAIESEARDDCTITTRMSMRGRDRQ